MFPAETHAWQGELPAKRYWGLHHPLTSLPSLLTARLSAEDAADAELTSSLQDDAKRAVADYLLQVSLFSNLPKPRPISAQEQAPSAALLLLCPAVSPHRIPGFSEVPGLMWSIVQQDRCMLPGCW